MVGILLSYWGVIIFRGLCSFQGGYSPGNLRHMGPTWKGTWKSSTQVGTGDCRGICFLVPWRVFPNISPSWNHFGRPQIPKQAWITVAATEDGDVEEKKKGNKKHPKQVWKNMCHTLLVVNMFGWHKFESPMCETMMSFCCLGTCYQS